MPRKCKRKRKYPNRLWRHVRAPTEPRNPLPYPFNELDFWQKNFIRALFRDNAPSPRAAMCASKIDRWRFGEWMDHHAFFIALAITAHRKLGPQAAASKMTVLFRFMLSRPVANATQSRGGSTASFFNHDEEED